MQMDLAMEGQYLQRSPSALLTAIGKTSEPSYLYTFGSSFPLDTEQYTFALLLAGIIAPCSATGVYNVYLITINVSVENANRYQYVKNYLQRQFGVWLLQTSPELIPLWPPMVVEFRKKDSEITSFVTSFHSTKSPFSFSIQKLYS